jgi:prolipoprotein diacylglyceryltransferase
MATERHSLADRAIGVTTEFLALFFGALLGVVVLGYLFLPQMDPGVLFLVAAIVAAAAILGAMVVRWTVFELTPVWRK